MRVVAVDSETHLIRPGRPAPPISCMSFQKAEAVVGSCGYVPKTPQLLHWKDALPLLVEWLTDKDTILVGHNLAFDLAVFCVQWPELIPLVFRALQENRLTDTMLRQKLIDIGCGCYRGYYDEDTQEYRKLGYTLLELARRCAGIPIKKEGFRLFYGPLRDVPLEQWVGAAKDLQRRGQAWLDGANDDTFEELATAYGDCEKFRTETKGMVAADANEVISYPLDDASSTLAVFLSQEREEPELLVDQHRRARTAWWQHLTSVWGLRTNAAGVGALQMQTQRACEKIEAKLIEAGLVRKDGSRDTKLAKQRMLDVCGWQWDEGVGKFVPIEERQLAGDLLALRLTPAGQPQLDDDACKATEDELLVAYAELTSLKTVLNKDVPALARGVMLPVHTHFDIAETGRATSANPNVMNWRRLPGIRECFVPRKGKVYAQADYSGLELATLAQACIDLLGYSNLADVLNAGKDPHTDLAGLILGITYEEGERRRKLSSDASVKKALQFRRTKLREPTAADLDLSAEEFLKYEQYRDFDNARQTAKVANFGFPGGLGAKKLVLFARKTYGVDLGATEEEAIEAAKQLKRIWLEKWPEMNDYFAHVTSLPSRVDSQGRTTFTLKQLRSNRLRAGATYTAACNSYFQGLGADATAAAGWLIAYACYVDRESPLFGCRIVNYVHDEFILECPEATAAEAAEELSRLMVLGASEWIPDVKLQAEPCLMTAWSKDAKTIRDTTGRLQAWSPEELKQAA